MYGTGFTGKDTPDSVIRVELLAFFSQNPGLIISSPELAIRMQRGARQVKSQMERLVDLRILEKGEVDGRICYSYIPPLSNGVRRQKGRKSRLDHPVNANGNNGDNEHTESRGFNKGRKPDEIQTSIRLELLIAAHKTKSWKQCLELLLDAVSHIEGASCAALLLQERCSQVVWECRRAPTFGRSNGLTKTIPDSMVIEGELIRNGGLIDTAHCVKYLHYLDDKEAILICVFRNGSYDMDIGFLNSLFTDFMPIVEEKRRLNLISEKSAERMLQDCIYWSAVTTQDIVEGVDFTLASLAKGIEADRVSLLLCNDDGCLQASSTYGALKSFASPRQLFPLGIGVVGWCVEHGNTANVVNTKVDPRFISGRYDDIDSMLCCPIILPGGEAVGALCAVNKSDATGGDNGYFGLDDIRLMEGTADVLAHAFSVKGHREIPTPSPSAAAVAS
jgi:hypothetical protein